MDAYFNTMGLVRDPMREQLFSSKLKRELQGWNAVEIFHDHARRAGTDDPLALIQYIDLHTYLPGDINTKGRPGQHGALAGGARTPDGPPARRMSTPRCRPASSCGIGEARVILQEGHGAHAAA